MVRFYKDAPQPNENLQEYTTLRILNDRVKLVLPYSSLSLNNCYIVFYEVHLGKYLHTKYYAFWSLEYIHNTKHYNDEFMKLC